MPEKCVFSQNARDNSFLMFHHELHELVYPQISQMGADYGMVFMSTGGTGTIWTENWRMFNNDI